MGRRSFLLIVQTTLMVLLLVCVLLPLAVITTASVVEVFTRYGAPNTQEQQHITDNVTVPVPSTP